MKLTALLLIGACLHVHAVGFGQKISLSETNVPIETVFSKIEGQTNYKFLFALHVIKDARKITINIKDAKIEEVLDLIFQNQNFGYKINENTVVVKPRKKLSHKEQSLVDIPVPIEVRGIITDENGAPVQGVNIVVKGTNKGTTTNLKGEFVLTGVDENAVLLITSVGYDRQEVLVKNKTFITTRLKVAVGNLDEMQVIGYGTTSRRFSTGNVSTVKAVDIEKQPVQNPLLALQGRVPGIEITQLTGLPGGGVNVLIQGRNSINTGNGALNPLIVVDGVPYPAELYLNNVMETLLRGGSPLNYINTADIESIDVLKDADATAIYGSRAANGAILITTKKGKAGRTKLSVNLQQGWGKVTQHADMMNTRQYLDMRYEAYKNDGIDITTLTPGSSNYDLTLWDTTRNTDWQKELIGGTAQYTNINASISGGNTVMQYLVGGTYNRQTSVFPGDFAAKSGGLHFNINGASANQKFNIQLSGSYSYAGNGLPGVDLTRVAVLTEPVAPPLYNDNGILNWALNAAGNSTWLNPLVNILSTDYEHTSKNIISSANISYRILPGLQVSSSFGFNNLQNDQYSPYRIEWYKPEQRPTSQRSASYGKRNMTSWIIEPQIRYSGAVSKGKMEALLGLTYQKNGGNVLQLLASGFANDQLMQSPAAAPTRTVQSYNSFLYKYNAIFGRLNYVWDEKYIINLTGRRDGSSRFGDKNKFHNFSSVGLGWVFSEEKWMQRLNLLSFGKLRASYGTTGSDGIGDYQYISTYSVINDPIPYQGNAGLLVQGLPNPHLQWQSTEKWQAGADIGFLNDRILLGATHARNISSNQLIGYILPFVTGYGGIAQNFPATIRNTSWEFTLNTVNIKTKDFNWKTSVNVTIPRNKLVSFPNIEKTAYASGTLGVIIGEPLGVIKVYRYAGLDPATGKYMGFDKDGNATATFNAAVIQDGLVSPATKYYGGLINSISYKGVQLDVTFQFVRRLDTKDLYYNDGGNRFPGFFTAQSSNQPVTLLNHWQKPGDNAEFAGFYTRNPTGYPFWPFYTDALYSYDASYIRLKNLSLSWQLPARYWEKLKIQNCLFYFQGQNLLTITNYTGLDPESHSIQTLPPLQMWTVGVKLEL